MGKETLWLDRLSSWIEVKDESLPFDPSILELSEEWRKASLEAKSFLQSSDDLERAFSQIIEKLEISP